jgi:hypothetical protein
MNDCHQSYYGKNASLSLFKPVKAGSGQKRKMLRDGSRRRELMSQQFEGSDTLTDGKGRKKFEKHHRETSISDMDNVSVTEVANVQNVSKSTIPFS